MKKINFIPDLLTLHREDNFLKRFAKYKTKYPALGTSSAASTEVI